jgi:hypothetical protein
MDLGTISSSDWTFLSAGYPVANQSCQVSELVNPNPDPNMVTYIAVWNRWQAFYVLMNTCITMAVGYM